MVQCYLRSASAKDIRVFKQNLYSSRVAVGENVGCCVGLLVGGSVGSLVGSPVLNGLVR